MQEIIEKNAKEQYQSIIIDNYPTQLVSLEGKVHIKKIVHIPKKRKIAEVNCTLT